jgi:glutathione synthase/RimK-type ligase-like ATP-grasp enzyme
MTKRQIALVSYAKYPALTASDQLLADAIAAQRAAAVPVIWDDAAVDWAQFDAIVVRSTWDYHQRGAEFAAWLERLAAQHAPLYNTAHTLRWNMDKHYLLALAEAGIAIPETVWLEAGTSPSLAHILQQKGWEEAVIKPAISASATDTWLVNATNADESATRLLALVQHQSMMVQQFLPEISIGEWSLMYFGGVYSHAVLKTPAKGDMRVQAEFGGSSTLMRAPDELIVQGQQILAAAKRITGDMPLYARVDGVEVEGKFVLMELELIEPHLFFECDAAAAGKMARAIMASLSE